MLKNEKVLANEDVFLIIILQSAIQLINGKSALVREQPRTGLQISLLIRKQF